MANTDVRLLKPIVVFDPVNQLDTFSVPVKVIRIDDEVVFEFSYIKKVDEITPPCRKITFEMCNRFSQIQEFTGYIWEKSYQKLIKQGAVSIPFLTMGNFILDSYLNYHLIVYTERNLMSLIPIPSFETEDQRTEYILGNYWNFFMWSKENLPEYWDLE